MTVDKKMIVFLTIKLPLVWIVAAVDVCRGPLAAVQDVGDGPDGVHAPPP